MTKKQFLELMRFPIEWREWNMYPDELYKIQRRAYEPGNEQSPEHHRNGAFHWWLSANPSAGRLIKLIFLTIRDPDQLMAGDVRKHIARRSVLSKTARAFLMSYRQMEKRLSGMKKGPR